MFCEKCGTRVEDGQPFCPNCGNRLAAPAAPVPPVNTGAPGNPGVPEGAAAPVNPGIPTGSFEYPDTRKRLRLSQAEMKRSGAQGAILARDSFTGFAQAATGGRVLRSATTLGALLAVLSGAIGLLFMGVLASLPAYETATAVNLLLYILAWLAPTLLLTGWGRHF